MTEAQKDPATDPTRLPGALRDYLRSDAARDTLEAGIQKALEENGATAVTAEEVEAMLSYGNEALRERDYRSYYLYRQKYMTGSFENVGWCMHGFENLYNIYMMEEMHSILSLGAGGVTKLVAGGKITRLSNPKYPQEYIRDIEQIKAKKREVAL